MRDVTGNLPLFKGVFPDYAAPIVRNAPDGVRELSTAQWGMPSPQFALKGRTPIPPAGDAFVAANEAGHWQGGRPPAGEIRPPLVRRRAYLFFALLEA